MDMDSDQVLIFIPTYNEQENVVKMIKELQALNLNCTILFMDDNSPDGTGQILDEQALEHKNLKVIHRSGKLGIGSAHREGLLWAYENGYNIYITLDCDFTHPPEYIPKLIEVSEDSDIVITSRYLQKGSLDDWNPFRKLLTNLGHFLTYSLLGMKYDATGAFRLYRLDRISRHFIDMVSSRGYSFFFESLFLLDLNKYKICEIPIVLSSRTYGHSKMRFSDAWFSFKFLFVIFINSLFNKEKFEICTPVFEGAASCYSHDEWELYWQEQKSSGGLIYELIATFYRKFIIKPSLNHFLTTTFAPGNRLLHAGCGGGQVDVDVCTKFNITGLDISVNALNMYNKVVKESVKLIHGSIFNIPVTDGTFDGVYNLGVMEHFSVDEIGAIMGEFRRVLRPGGRIMLFWPPEYGISVVFFKMLKKLLAPIYGNDIKFHPDEITRIKSRRELTEIVGDRFLIEKYYFGWRSFATYVICVLSVKDDGNSGC